LEIIIINIHNFGVVGRRASTFFIYFEIRIPDYWTLWFI